MWKRGRTDGEATAGGGTGETATEEDEAAAALATLLASPWPSAGDEDDEGPSTSLPLRRPLIVNPLFGRYHSVA